jgi:hypothetical protein
MRTKLVVLAAVFGALALIGIVAGYLSGDEQPETNPISETLRDGKVVFRSGVKEGAMYPDEYFAEELTAPFAEYMADEFRTTFPKFGLSEALLQSNGASLKSEGSLIVIKNHKAMMATVSIGPFENGQSLWSIYLMGNGQHKSISAQCIGQSETADLVFEGECSEQFVALLQDDSIR